ncbi:hypothetical protein L195_g062110, partial [Trifolium pratense]
MAEGLFFNGGGIEERCVVRLFFNGERIQWRDCSSTAEDSAGLGIFSLTYIKFIELVNVEKELMEV